VLSVQIPLSDSCPYERYPECGLFAETGKRKQASWMGEEAYESRSSFDDVVSNMLSVVFWWISRYFVVNSASPSTVSTRIVHWNEISGGNKGTTLADHAPRLARSEVKIVITNSAKTDCT
jgi:hypothetical protein